MENCCGCMWGAHPGPGIWPRSAIACSASGEKFCGPPPGWPAGKRVADVSLWS